MRKAEPVRPVEQPESALQAAWAALRGPSAMLLTEEGERLEVLFTGLPNHGPGPDFRGAVIATERGRLVRGDVEVHREPAGWREHGHDHDARYDGVVLHVVGSAGDHSVTALPHGGRAPVVALASGQSPPVGKVEHPCAGCAGAGPPEALAARLDLLGEVRLGLKARLWQRGLDRGADAALAVACLDLLGVPRNRAAMRQVCRAVAAAMAAPGLALRYRQAALLRAAGLSPPKGPPDRLAAEFLTDEEPEDRDLPIWDVASCRPVAHPVRRLLGAAVWFDRWARAGGPVRWLRDAGSEPAGLVTAFTVTAPEAEITGPAPIGGSRAAALVVNVAYPFLLAAAEASGDRERASALRECYRRLRALEPDGVVRPLSEALGLGGLRLTACQQQGLHHLNRRSCQRGRQAQCLLAIEHVPAGRHRA